MRKAAVVLVISMIGFVGATLLTAPAGARVADASGLCRALTNLHYTPSSDPTAAGGFRPNNRYAGVMPLLQLPNGTCAKTVIQRRATDNPDQTPITRTSRTGCTDCVCGSYGVGRLGADRAIWERAPAGRGA